jgi:hypothetical protein
MTTAIAISKTLSIRDCGYDENWLQDQIAADPSILGLGDLEVVRREEPQPSGGRLDFLLKNPEDTMYEVEVMLGETDASHIIRTIEYWAGDQRRWPLHQHFAVLVAETITRRFFDVIQLLSHSIPIIAIQANLIEANGARSLHFTTILDAYEEPEDEAPAPEEACNESWWRTHSASTLDTAKALLKVVLPIYGRIELSYAKSCIALRTRFSQFSLRARSGNKSGISFFISQSDFEAVSRAFVQKGVSIINQKAGRIKDETKIVLTVDQEFIEANADLFRRIAEFVKKWYEVGDGVK